MKRLVEYELEGGGSVLVEIDSPPAGGMNPVGIGDGVVEKAQAKLEEALDGIRPIAEAVVSRLADLPSRPDEISIKLGFKIGANGTLVIASTAVEGQCEVTLGWKRPAATA
jgi:hypothetical protein